jgi:HNH endonuclease
MTQAEWDSACQEQRTEPVFLLSMNGKNLWQFNDRFYWDTDGLDGSQVYALLFTRNARQKQNIERAQAITAMGMLPQQQTRAGIPDDLKLLVWQRDGGQCRSCCGRVELQYDHIIPVAMGGATSAENLQILCGPATGARARA